MLHKPKQTTATATSQNITSYIQMVNSQDNEDKATVEYLRGVWVALLQSDGDTTSYAKLREACGDGGALKRLNLQQDEQLALTLKQIAAAPQAGSSDGSAAMTRLTFGEFVQAYKSVIASMQSLQLVPKPRNDSARERIRARIAGFLHSFTDGGLVEVPIKVTTPVKIKLPNDNESGVVTVTTSRRLVTASPAATPPSAGKKEGNLLASLIARKDTQHSASTAFLRTKFIFLTFLSVIVSVVIALSIGGGGGVVAGPPLPRPTSSVNLLAMKSDLSIAEDTIAQLGRKIKFEEKRNNRLTEIVEKNREREAALESEIATLSSGSGSSQHVHSSRTRKLKPLIKSVAISGLTLLSYVLLERFGAPALAGKLVGKAFVWTKERKIVNESIKLVKTFYG